MGIPGLSHLILVLANVHDQIPHQHQTPSNARIQVPEPETEEQGTKRLLSKLCAEEEEVIPKFTIYLIVNYIFFMLCFTILECTSIRQNVVFWPRSPRTSNGDPFVVARFF